MVASDGGRTHPEWVTVQGHCSLPAAFFLPNGSFCFFGKELILIMVIFIWQAMWQVGAPHAARGPRGAGASSAGHRRAVPGLWRVGQQAALRLHLLPGLWAIALGPSSHHSATPVPAEPFDLPPLQLHQAPHPTPSQHAHFPIVHLHLFYSIF